MKEEEEEEFKSLHEVRPSGGTTFFRDGGGSLATTDLLGIQNERDPERVREIVCEELRKMAKGMM